jgi:hypothetical protein
MGLAEWRNGGVVEWRSHAKGQERRGSSIVALGARPKTCLGSTAAVAKAMRPKESHPADFGLARSSALTASHAAFHNDHRATKPNEAAFSSRASAALHSVMEARLIFVSDWNELVENGGSSRLQMRQCRNIAARRGFVHGRRKDGRCARVHGAVSGGGDGLQLK